MINNLILVLCVVSCQTTLKRNSIYCMAPFIFNKLPNAWKDLNTVMFKSRLRNLFDKTYYSVAEFLADKIVP